MSSQAVVILGAGASHDLMDPREEELSANPAYKPPLTENVFSSQPSFQRILNNYQDAAALAESIRFRLRKVNYTQGGNLQGEQLEPLLREFSESSEAHRRKQFREVPLYLQELFGEISDNYAVHDSVRRLPPNYTHLVNELLARFDRVAFVTLNYDLFLEQALSVPSLAGPVSDLSWYHTSKRWMLFKLHGSVNWGRKILVYPKPRYTLRALEAIGETELEDNLDEEIRLLPERGHLTRWIDQVPYYPAIVVPLEGKYGFSCPPDHVANLTEFLRSSSEILVIGLSGKDADLLDLLKASLSQVINFFLVDNGSESLKETKNRLLQGVPQLRPSMFKGFHNGFTHFVQARGIEQFAQTIPRR